jgi:hypothetical protein
MAFSPVNRSAEAATAALRSLLGRSVRPPVPRPGPPGPTRPPVQNLVSQFVNTGSGYGDMSTAAQAVNDQIDPQLKAITEDFNNRAQNATSTIGGIYNNYANQLGAEYGATKGIYDPQIQTLTGTMQGVGGNILQAGEHAQAGLSSALSQAGLPAGAGGSDINLEGEGQGASAAAMALGKASIQALKKSEDAALAYASQLPGFAKLEGDQQTRTVLAQLAAAMTQQLAGVTAQAPALYYQIYNDLQDRRRQAAQDAEAKREFDVQQNAAAQRQKAGIAGPNAPTTAGRLAYWQAQAAQRSKDTGDIYVATPTGIRPYDTNPKVPGIQKQRTEAGRVADSLAGARVANTANQKARTRIAQQGADTAATRAQTAIDAENNRHSENVAKIKVAQQNAGTARGRAAATAAADREKTRHNKALEAIQKRRAAETHRHNVYKEQHPTSSGGRPPGVQTP